MSTTTVNPQVTENFTHKVISVRKNVFDLDSKSDVLVAKIGDFEPVTTMEEFVSRLGNNAAAILQIVNDGLEKYTENQLAASDTPWQLVEEDENGNETLSAFSGTLISEEKSKSLNATVINLAKAIFGYAKQMVPGDAEKNREAKKAAKAQAMAMILSNPAAIEGLKK
jgi:hypothetical protein